jgi:threonine dehydrogenase-like Zn-dependent dehydrogenase
MKALSFQFDLKRLAAARILGAFGARGYLSRLGPVRYGEVPDSEIHRDDWVVVQTRYTGICGSDLKQVFLEGATDNPIASLISFPHVMGHEMVGTVVDVGKDVTRVSKGDRVACYPWLSCVPRGLQECRACRDGRLTSCERFTDGDLAPGMHAGNCRDVSGGFARLLPAHESMCFPIPEAVSFENAALADPFAVALHAIGKAPPQAGERVLVFGLGTLGLLLIHILERLYPGVEVIGVDVHEHLRERVEGMGARFVSARGEALVDEIGAIVGSPPKRGLAGLPWLLGGVDKIYDSVGSAATLEVGVRICRPQGRIVLVGVAAPARFEWTPLYFKEIEIIGSNGCGFEPWEGRRSHAFEVFLDLVARQRIDPGALVTHTFPLDRYVDAFLTARRKPLHRSIKVLFDLDPS